MDTTKTITHISLCAGYGGIDIGLKRCLPALRTILVSEIEAYAVANLVTKMEAGQLDPAPIWTDLKTLPLDCIPKKVSILSGGFPCQPFSAAGKREGDEDPRHLFPFIKNAIRIIQPGLVFLENVEGIISAKLKGDGWEDPAGTPVLLHVLRELERVGYNATAGVFSAAEVGATHQRKRVFILARKNKGSLVPTDDCRNRVSLGEIGERATKELADTGGTGCKRPKREGEARAERQPDRHIAECGSSLADSNDSGRLEDWITSQLRTSGVEQSSCHRWPSRPGEAQQEWEEPRVVGDADSGRQLQSKRSEQTFRGRDSNPSTELADSEHDGCTTSPRPGETCESEQDKGWSEESASTEQLAGGGEQQQVCCASELADPGHTEPPGRGEAQKGGEGQPCGKSAPQDCGNGELADTSGGRCEQRQPQREAEGNADNKDQQGDGHETESQLGGTVDGTTSGLDPTANRVDRLRLLGNGVVPNTCEIAFRTLFNELTNK